MRGPPSRRRGATVAAVLAARVALIVLALVLAAGCGGSSQSAQEETTTGAASSPPTLYGDDASEPLDFHDKGRINANYPIRVDDVDYLSNGKRVSAFLVRPPHRAG